MAIIALLLASGVRLSEAVNLDLKDLHLNMMVIEVTRKGGKRDSVNIAAFAKPYLEEYLKIRAPRYKAEKQDQALFFNGIPWCSKSYRCIKYRKISSQILTGFQSTCNTPQAPSHSSNAIV